MLCWTTDQFIMLLDSYLGHKRVKARIPYLTDTSIVQQWVAEAVQGVISGLVSAHPPYIQIPAQHMQSSYATASGPRRPEACIRRHRSIISVWGGRNRKVKQLPAVSCGASDEIQVLSYSVPSENLQPPAAICS